MYSLVKLDARSKCKGVEIKDKMLNQYSIA